MVASALSGINEFKENKTGYGSFRKRETTLVLQILHMLKKIYSTQVLHVSCEKMTDKNLKSLPQNISGEGYDN